MKQKILQTVATGLVATSLMAGAASAADIRVTITNHSTTDGLFLTPLLSFFHDGSVDSFDFGNPASTHTGIEELAEGGGTAPFIAANPTAKAGVITSPGGFGPAPVIDPGETASLMFNLDPTTDRYFSFLSMIIPSNDLFIGNEDPLAHEVFDTAGLFTNLGPINVYGADVWDAGTEENNNLGAAFNPAGGSSNDETNPISQLFNGGDLTFLLGQGRAAGGTVGNVQGAGDLLASIEIEAVPLPAGMPLLLAGLGALGFARRKQQAKSAAS